jgi:hypothetical protein
MITPAQRAAREKWIQALESGNYEQTQRALARRTSAFSVEFCCLGVACEISRENTAGWVGVDGVLGFPVSDGYYRITTEKATMPDPVQQELGFMTDAPVVYAPEFLDHPANISEDGDRMAESGWFGLTELNDEYNASFEEIAGILRRQADDWDGRISAVKGEIDA